MTVLDTFPFFCEWDQLEIRLNELRDVVDRHVLLESTKTFTFKDKPLYFSEYKGSRFDEFKDRIEVVVLADFTGVDTSQPFEVDHNQRDTLLNATRYRGADWILQSDADEIPTAEAVRKLHTLTDESLLAFSQTCCYYYADAVQHVPLYGTHAIRPGIALSGQQCRDFRGRVLTNGGVHLGYLGDIPYKLTSAAHTEYDCPPYNQPEHIARCKAEGKDLFGRPGFDLELVQDVSYLPRFLLDNMDRYPHLFHPQGFHAGNNDAGEMRNRLQGVPPVDVPEGLPRPDGT